MDTLILLIWLPALFYISSAVIYHILLAFIFFLKKDTGKEEQHNLFRYLLLVPAHNEEPVIEKLLKSTAQITYSRSNFKTVIIADNCRDKTAALASSYNVEVLERTDPIKRGKGHAIAWALDRINLNEFDAVVIVDADNVIDPGFFHGLNIVLNRGARAVQCFNSLANPDESFFTRIMYLSRVVNNQLYHHAKYKLGLSAYLMGNGMCFTSALLKEFPWTASSIAEDYEYYARLVGNGEMIAFAADAKIYHQESEGLQQATKQRIRWSSGRFEIARNYGFHLLKTGFKEKNYKIADAALPLVFPNLSLMVNMTLIVLVLSLALNVAYPVPLIIFWVITLLLLEIAYFTAGVYLTGMPLMKFVTTLLSAPLVLIWKGCIDVIGIAGKKKGQWGRAR